MAAACGAGFAALSACGLSQAASRETRARQSVVSSGLRVMGWVCIYILTGIREFIVAFCAFIVDFCIQTLRLYSRLVKRSPCFSSANLMRDILLF